MSAQPSAQPFSKRDAKTARQSYQHVAHVVDRLLNRLVQSIPDEAVAKKYFRASVFATVHGLHGFLNGREVSQNKPVIKAHKFVVKHFAYRGDVENSAAVSRYMGRHLDDLRLAELACGYDLVQLTRADNQTLLFTAYEGHPLLDVAEWVYWQARSAPDYWKNPAKAITDQLLDEAIAKLPKVELKPGEQRPTSGSELEDSEAEVREQWDSADLMAGKIVKGMWTKVINGAERALVKEFDSGADPELAARREAAKIIELGKAIKAKLARERLRFSMQRAEDVADGEGKGIGVADILEEVEATARTRHADTVVYTVSPETTCPEEPTLDRNVGGTSDYVLENQEFDDSSIDDFAVIRLRNALDYAAAGIAVLPLWGVADGICDCAAGSECRTAGKHPHSFLARTGVYSATTDAVRIQKWFKRDPRINLGVAMGGPLNLICVDIDPRNDGDATYCDLVEAHGADAFPETFTVKTGGGGWHRYYRLPEAIKPKKGELKGELGPGVDIKGVGGQVVAPGSIHASGGFYEVETNEYIAEAPPWLVAELVKANSGEKPEKVVDFQAHRDRKRSGVSGSTIVQGERNKRLFKVGCALWGKGEVSDYSELYAKLYDVNLERISPPLDLSEVAKIAESIAGRYALGVPVPEDAA